MKAIVTGASSGIGRDMAKLQTLIEQLEETYEQQTKQEQKTDKETFSFQKPFLAILLYKKGKKRG
mgnify:CR=1 FL=1